MSVDPLRDDIDALRALVSQLSGERGAAVEENRRLTAQNDDLRHLLKKLQNAQFGKKSERLDRDQLQSAMEDLETAPAKHDARGREKARHIKPGKASDRSEEAADQSRGAAGAFAADPAPSSRRARSALAVRANAPHQ